jgi:hypothetical protein
VNIFQLKLRSEKFDDDDDDDDNNNNNMDMKIIECEDVDRIRFAEDGGPAVRST